jgi:hypothetical protein
LLFILRYTWENEIADKEGKPQVRGIRFSHIDKMTKELALDDAENGDSLHSEQG